jgi:hypothetical protein
VSAADVRADALSRSALDYDPSVERPVAREMGAARRDLAIVVVAIVGLARLLDGPLSWVVAGLLLAAVVLASLEILGRLEAPGTEGGVPIESLILPAVAAIGCLGAIDLVPVGILLVPALAATAFLVDRALVLEERILVSERGLTPEDRSSVLVATLLVGFVGFVGAGTLAPGGLVGGAGSPAVPLSGSDVVVIALADAVVAGLLGYRAAALRVVTFRDALLSAATYAIAIAIGAAALRAMAIPRLIGPALLTLAFYLWDTFHGTAPSRRRDPQWIWQMAVLVVLGALVAGWNLLLRG